MQTHEPPSGPPQAPLGLKLPDGDRLLPIETVASLLGFKTTAGVRTLVSPGILKVSARGARRRAFFKEHDVLTMMTNKQALVSEQSSPRTRRLKTTPRPKQQPFIQPTLSMQLRRAAQRRQRLIEAQGGAL